jgi:pyruvate/2-oxoglutarate dehydrogenase complex dihydrolipoamide acyltransferase (E2) component
MGYQITRPDTDQIVFRSSKTGEHVLDAYLEGAERGTRTLGQMMADLFDTSGAVRTDTAAATSASSAQASATAAQASATAAASSASAASASASSASTSQTNAAASASAAAASAASINPANLVATTGDQTIDGVKTFSTAPVVGTAAEKTSTTSAANTAFVDRMRSLATQSTASGGGTLVVGDRGALVSVTAGVTVPASVFAANDTLSIYNNSATGITITQGAGLTLRQVGTATTGNRTLAQRGLATIVFISATEAVISGGGLT